jgi:HK97 family phage portal protein
MNKARKRTMKSARDAPARQLRNDAASSWFCNTQAWSTLVGDGYRPLSQCPEVKMCVGVYADLISNMTLYLMQNTDKGDKRVKNELSRKVDIEPYSLMTRKAWMYNIVATLLLAGDGNQVTYPTYTPEGYIKDLRPLKPSRLIFMDTNDGYVIRYGETILRPDEVLHFVLHPDAERPWIGTGLRVALKDIVKGIRQANATKQALLESPSPSIVVKVDGLTEEFASVEGRKKLGAQYLDASENGRPWFIPADTFDIKEVKPLTLNDLALAKNLELDKRTVAGLFGVPPFLVGVGDYKKDEYNSFIRGPLLSVAKVIEQELTRKLLYSPDLYWRFNPRSLYAYDLSEIVNAGGAMVDRMTMRRNEWRDWMGMSPDDEMNELLALENYVPANMLGKQKKLTGTGGDGNGQGDQTGADPAD